MTTHYDDPQFSYTEYWQGRDYEHLSEEVALRKLFDGVKGTTGVDIGGGYGRLTSVLLDYAKKVILVEPSAKLRAIARKKLKTQKKIGIVFGTAEKTGLSKYSQDVVMVIRVLHHIPNLRPAFSELNRIMKPGGKLVIEFANSLNLKARIRSLLLGQPILPTAIDLRSQSNIRKATISFVNHHPHTVLKLLRQSGFEVEKTLSVSNLRLPILKKFVPLGWMIKMEVFLQSVLARWYVGPSIFILAKKTDVSV